MIKGLKWKLILFLVSFFASALAVHSTFAGTKPPEQGDVLPRFVLQVPEDTNARNYLGLSGSGTFTIPSIDAQVVIIQLFSRY